MGRRRGDSRRTHAGVIGETAAGYAEADRIHNADSNRAQHAAAYCIRAECHHENLIKTMRNRGEVPQDARQTGNNIQNRHRGNQYGRYFGNRLNAAQNNDQGQNRQTDTGYCDGDFKSLFQGGRNGVRLGQVADTERRKHGEQRKQETESFTQRFIF